MLCEEFFNGYSEYLDGRLDGQARAAFDAHRDACRSCGRYDGVVRRGVHIWRNLPEIDPSPDFVPRLRHRLYHVDDESRLSHSRHVGSAALVAVASVGLLALAWLPFATRMAVEVELPAVAVEAPVVFPSTGGAATVLRSGARAVGGGGASAASGSLFGSGPFVMPNAGSFQWAVSAEIAPGGFELPAIGWTPFFAPAHSASSHATTNRP